MNETRTRNEYGDYVCTVCGTTSNFHYSVANGTDEAGFTQWTACPNEAREPRPQTHRDGLVHGIVQALRRRDEGEYVVFDWVARKFLRETETGFAFATKETATVYRGITEASIRAMMAGGEARVTAL